MPDLSALTTAFMNTFNDGDFDRMLALLSPTAIYVDPNDTEHRGPEAIGASLKSIFDGTLGTVSYKVKSTVINDDLQLSLVTWTMVMTTKDGSASSVEGLDILRFEDGRLVSKDAYCKAETLAIQSVG